MTRNATSATAASDPKMRSGIATSAARAGPLRRPLRSRLGSACRCVWRGSIGSTLAQDATRPTQWREAADPWARRSILSRGEGSGRHAAGRAAPGAAFQLAGVTVGHVPSPEFDGGVRAWRNRLRSGAGRGADRAHARPPAGTGGRNGFPAGDRCTRAPADGREGPVRGPPDRPNARRMAVPWPRTPTSWPSFAGAG